MRYKDTWKRKLKQSELDAYKAIIDDGTIANAHATYYRKSGITEIEYDSDEDLTDIHEKLRIKAAPRDAIRA